VGTGSPESIRAALARKELAAALQRAALAGLLGLEERDVLAVQHLALAGRLTPTQLAAQLRMSSGGVTALLARLQRRGFVARAPHPLDRRSTTVALTPAIERLAGEAVAPLVEEIDRLVRGLPAEQRHAVDRFLGLVAAAADRAADDLARAADAREAEQAPRVARLLT
jgi:DNA-binding MarR family transcriptional regulator